MCEIDDVNTTVWEEIKGAEPHVDCHAATYLLRRARQRLSRPAAGAVSRIDSTSLEGRTDTHNALLLGSQTDGAGEVRNRIRLYGRKPRPPSPGGHLPTRPKGPSSRGHAAH